jgi:lipid A 4'-phosphatase
MEILVNRKMSLHAAIIVILLVAATVVIASLGLDMKITAAFYVSGKGFAYGDLQPWRALYSFGDKPAILMAGSGLLVFILGFIKPRFITYRNASIFLVLFYILAPGLLINVILKDHWGRPRPCQVEEFGGTFQFRQPWQYSGNNSCRSFPCGHASVGFYMFAPYFILRQKDKRWARVWLTAGIGYGMIVGAARIIQGGHFLSDVLWSGGLTYLLGLFLAVILHLNASSIELNKTT